MKRRIVKIASKTRISAIMKNTNKRILWTKRTPRRPMIPATRPNKSQKAPRPAFTMEITIKIMQRIKRMKKSFIPFNQKNFHVSC